jgi:hypothetical protein
VGLYVLPPLTRLRFIRGIRSTDRGGDVSDAFMFAVRKLLRVCEPLGLISAPNNIDGKKLLTVRLAAFEW